MDYALVDADGALLEDPVCYRDDRTKSTIAQVRQRIPDGELFARTGVQMQPFNTLYQLFAQVQAGKWPPRAARLLFMPDLFHYLLSGEQTCECTMASTSQLLQPRNREWNRELVGRLELPGAVLGELIVPGTTIGTLQPELGLGALRVVAPAAHDTASAVAGTPLQEGFAFLSSGTWSLLGVETSAPLLTEGVRAENLTNEAGVAGTNRLLKNIMGLWILESCRAIWEARGEAVDWESLVPRIDASPAMQARIEPDDARFFHPQNMVDEVRAALRETGQPAPEDPGALTRIILESLARRYAEVVRALEQVTDRAIRGVHVIGGGAQNDFLNQATADATGREVIAGPIEATALGNLLVQAIADGRFTDLAQARAFIAAHIPTKRFTPQA